MGSLRVTQQPPRKGLSWGAGWGGGRFDSGTRFNSAPTGAEAAAHRRPLITSTACLHGVSHTDESVNNSLVLLLISAGAIN